MASRGDLEAYKARIDHSIDRYCERLLQETQAEFGPYSFEAMETYVSLLKRGGKRLRGALVMAMYTMTGGTDEAMSVEAARIIEMLNTNLLIFDDIADLSAKRRGGPTVHTMFETYHREAKLFGDSQHYGFSMAMHVALAGTYLVENEVAALKVDAAAKLAATTNMNEAILTAINGQLNDITNEAVRLVNEKQVERTLTWKSAYYTFLQPMQFGMLLAGSKHAELPMVREYAMHLGLAFQIIDDIIGTFGTETKTGKSTSDDLKEGKITILVSRALQQGTAEQKRTLLGALGKHTLKPAEIKACKQVIRDTGALSYARELAAAHAQAAVQALEDAPKTWQPEGLQFLHSLAEYVTTREK